MAVEIVDEESELELQAPSLSGVSSYTISFWTRLPEVQAEDPPLPVFELIDDSGNSVSILKDSAGVYVKHVDDSPQLLTDSPPDYEWVFMALTINDSFNTSTLRWTMACEEFDEIRVIQSSDETSLSTTIDSLLLGNNVAEDRFVGARFSMARQWTADLSDEQLIEESESTNVVLTDDLWASNPLSTDADTSDESGNEQEAILVGLNSEDDPELCAQVEGPHVILSWTASSDGTYPVARYFLERSDEAEDGEYVSIASVEADAESLSYRDEDIEDGITYWYRVYAEDTEGNGGPYSNVERVPPDEE